MATITGTMGADDRNGTAGADTFDMRAGNDRADGRDGADKMHGGDGNDTLNGGAGADTLWGDAGSDLLRGGDGRDILIGGGGADSLYGGAGGDIFRFNFIERNNIDGVLDFSHADDLIDVSDIDANADAAGNQAFHFIGNAAFSGHAGELSYAYRPSLGATEVMMDVNGDRQVDMSIIVKGVQSMLTSDFLL